MPEVLSDSWWTRREAAAYTHVSEATIGREVRGGRLRHARVGGRRALRFKRDWLDEWMAAGRPTEHTVSDGHRCELTTSAPRYVRALRSASVPLT